MKDTTRGSLTIPNNKGRAKLPHLRFRTSFGVAGAKKFNKFSTANRIVTKYSGGGATGSVLENSLHRTRQRAWQQVGSSTRGVASSVKPSGVGGLRALLPCETSQEGSLVPDNSIMKDELTDEPQMELIDNAREIVKWEKPSLSAALMDNAIYLSDDEDEVIAVKKEPEGLMESLGCAVNNETSVNLQGIVQQALNQARLVNRSTAFCNQEQTYFDDANAPTNSSQQLSGSQRSTAGGQVWNYPQKQFSRKDEGRGKTTYNSVTRYATSSSSQQYSVSF